MFVAVLTILSQSCNKNTHIAECRDENIDLTSAIPENFELSKQWNGKAACPSGAIKMPLTKHTRCGNNKFGKVYFSTWCTKLVNTEVKPVSEPTRSLASIFTGNRQMETTKYYVPEGNYVYWSQEGKVLDSGVFEDGRIQ